MASENALIDGNNVPTKLCVLNTDTVQGTNLVRVKIHSSGGIVQNTTATISFTMQPIDPRDQNYKSVWMFQGTDNQIYPCVATSGGELLVDQA